MGFHYICGTCDPRLDEILVQIHNALKKVENHEDGSLDLEITLKGKTEEKIVIDEKDGEELLKIWSINKE